MWTAGLAVAEWLFIHTTYYCLTALALCWVGTHLHSARELSRAAAFEWLEENWRGILIALVATTVVGAAVEPALRVLSDEANLVGTSKNLFATKTATFTVSGKYYYDSYWDVDVAIDRRPALFPYLLSLVHALRGYSHANVFAFNLLVLPAFVLVSYRLAKSLGGETFAIAASLLGLAHPVTLLSIRSGGFDFFCSFFALLSLKSLLEYCRERTASKLALLWMNLCMFSEIRYETALFIPVIVGLLLAFKMLSWSTLRPYAFVYALTPVYSMPRVLQSILLGNIPEQDSSGPVVSLENFVNNAREYMGILSSPFDTNSAHSALTIALGMGSAVLWLRWLAVRAHARDWKSAELRFGIGVAAWMLLQATIVFSYVWGRAQYPTAARLFIGMDTFFSFGAAWLLTRYLKRWNRFVPALLAGSMVVTALPIAAQHRMFNRLTQTRESSTTWKFFESLQEKRILIVTDRPHLFTIMNYGAMNFETARRDPYLFTALARRLFYEVYVIQQVKLSTKEPVPGFEIWSEQKLDTVLEFQNDADVLVRISRVLH